MKEAANGSIATESATVTPDEQARFDRLSAERQERWTQLIRRRRMEEYGDPDSPLPVWPVKPPDVPREELQRIAEFVERAKRGLE